MKCSEVVVSPTHVRPLLGAGRLAPGPGKKQKGGGALRRKAVQDRQFAELCGFDGENAIPSMVAFKKHVLYGLHAVDAKVGRTTKKTDTSAHRASNAHTLALFFSYLSVKPNHVAKVYSVVRVSELVFRKKKKLLCFNLKSWRSLWWS